jgi:hypothetical protein
VPSIVRLIFFLRMLNIPGPKGAIANSQGREPLERIPTKVQSPEGSAANSQGRQPLERFQRIVLAPEGR